MPVDYEIKDQILHISVNGWWSSQIGHSVQAEAAKLCNDHGITRLLIDFRNAENLSSTIDIYEVTKDHARVFGSDVKHAVVLRKDEKLKQSAEFFETVARNRGIIAESFTSISDAIQWLKD